MSSSRGAAPPAILPPVAGPAFSREDCLILLAGFNLMLVNYTLIRQVTIAIRDLELAVIINSLAYFSGISLGYLLSGSVPARVLRRLLPLFLGMQMFLVLFLQVIVYRLGQHLGGAVVDMLVFILVAIGSSGFYAIFLPDMIESSGGNTRRYYSLEIAGGLAALMLLPLLAMAGYRWVFGGYLLSFLAIAVLLSASARNLALLSAMVLLFLGSYDALDKNLSAWFYRHWYAGAGVTRIIHTTYSPYHKVEVASDRNEHPMLLLNSHAQFTHAGHANYSYFAAEFPASILGGRPRACLLGCGSMSTVGRIGAMVRWIDIVDIDRAVFEVSKMHFAAYNHLDHLRNWTFHADDAKHFLASGREEFDLIIDDIPPARTRQVALTYTKEFFQLVESRLASRGIFSLPSLVSVEAHDSYGRKIAATMRSVFDKVFILQRRGTSYLYGCNAGFTFDRPRLIRALNHWDKDNVRFLGPDKVDRLIEGTPVITVNNTAELIYD